MCEPAASIRNINILTTNHPRVMQNFLTIQTQVQTEVFLKNTKIFLKTNKIQEDPLAKNYDQD